MRDPAVATTPPPPPPSSSLTPELRRLAVVTGLGAIMMQLDTTMTNVATKTFLQEFAVPLSTIQWVGTCYFLAMAVVIPLAGWAMERFGARATWTAAIGLFVVGSALCGLSWSAGSLIAFRAVQGLGAGMILPVAQAVLAQAAGPERLTKVMAAIGIPSLLGPVLGPVLGGVIVTELSWRWIFYVNVPICAAALVMSIRLVPAARAEGTRRLDPVDLLLVSAGSVALVYGFSAVARSGRFTDGAGLAAIAGGVLLLAGFAVHALRSGDAAPIDLRLLRERAFGSAAVVMFLSMAVMFGAMGLLPLFFQQVQGETALGAGVRMIPYGIGMGLSLLLAGRNADRVAPRTLALAGLGLAAAGALLLTGLAAGVGPAVVAAGQVLSGLGIGAVLVPVMSASMRGLRPQQIPRASASLRVFQQLGGSFSGALLFVVLQHRTTVRGGADLGLAFGDTFRWSVGMAVITLVAACFLPGRPASPATRQL